MAKILENLKSHMVTMELVNVTEVTRIVRRVERWIRGLENI